MMQLYYVRLPNVLGLETKPFDPDTYEESTGFDVMDEEENKKPLLPEAIRWRYKTNAEGNIEVRLT
jgi:hypothetical protein